MTSTPPQPSSAAPVVLITGASRGLGLNVAKILLHGSTTLTTPANVVTLSRTLTPALQELSASGTDSAGQSQAFQTTLIAVQGDATDQDDCLAAVGAAIKRWGRLDAVIFNAGTIEFARLADVTRESFARQMDSNLTSVITMLHHAIPHLRRSPTGCGKAVFVSSGAATGQTAAWGAYNASKAALNAIARTLANEEPSLAVWAVRPGVVDTEMQRSIRVQAKTSMRADEYARFETMHQQGKLLKPEQPAHVLAALALRGTRRYPRQPGKAAEGNSEGQETIIGAGAVGSFLNWDAEELQDLQLPQ